MVVDGQQCLPEVVVSLYGTRARATDYARKTFTISVLYVESRNSSVTMNVNDLIVTARLKIYHHNHQPGKSKSDDKLESSNEYSW